MKINESQSSATIVGDVQSNAVSIDINNIGFITQLLSTNLYSRPVESFLREIVSNAWDAHVEINNPDPILLEIGTDTEHRHYCRIQDFGIGLSPERFNNIYRNIGSSTKRADNTQIGGFGIGRFSALAYSDTVHLTSNFQGVKYKYLMYRDGNKISIDELFQNVTTDKDGFEVMIYLKGISDVEEFKNAIQSQLVYFENLYLSFDRFPSSSSQEFAKNFNNLKIKRYKHFSVNTFAVKRTTICLGKIQYPLNSAALRNADFKFEENYPIAINFEIGDLEVTPNREQILYSKDNIKKIEEKLNLVQEEIDEIIADNCKEDYIDFRSYLNAIKNNATKITLLEDFSTGESVYFNVRKSLKEITFNGEVMSNGVYETYTYMRNLNIYGKYASFKLEYGKIYSKDISYVHRTASSIEDHIVQATLVNKTTKLLKHSTYIGNLSDLNNASKDFLRSEQDYTTVYFLSPISYKQVYRAYRNEVLKEVKRNGMYTKLTSNYKVFKACIKDIFETFSKIEHFTNKSVPKDYLDTRAAQLKAKRANINTINWKEEVNLFKYRRSERYSYDGLNAAIESTRVSLETIKKSWHNFPVIYAEKGNATIKELYYVFSNIHGEYQKYVFIEIAPTKIKILEQFPNFIKLEDFMNADYKKIRMVTTAMLIKESYYPWIKSLYQNVNVIKEVSVKLADVIVKINNYVENNHPTDYYYSKDLEIYKELKQLCADKKYYDEEMVGFLRENKTLIENSKFISLLIESRTGLSNKLVNFMTDYALTKKLFIPDVDAVKRLRKETIFNNKIEDENTENQ